jgi:thiosulfate/3-mercaptopyruvate sulfurtransferase
MRPATLFALAVTPLLIGGGLNWELTPAPRSATSLVVTPEWLAAHQDDPDLIILEVGEGNNYKSGHIRRARPVNIMAFHSHGTGMPRPADLVPAIERLGISNSSRIVLYGDIHGISIFWVMLEYLGMGDQAFVLDGGKFGWMAAGESLTTEEPSYLAGKFVPHLRPGIIVDAGWIAAHLKDPKLALIDARSPAEFRGDADHMASPGHIPGAVNLDWERTYDSAGKLLTADSLRTLFAQAGYAPGDRLVVYCTVGMRASHLYFLARSLGYTPQLYLGSMNDWISNAERPVTRGSAN